MQPTTTTTTNQLKLWPRSHNQKLAATLWLLAATCLVASSINCEPLQQSAIAAIAPATQTTSSSLSLASSTSSSSSSSSLSSAGTQIGQSPNANEQLSLEQQPNGQRMVESDEVGGGDELAAGQQTPSITSSNGQPAAIGHPSLHQSGGVNVNSVGLQPSTQMQKQFHHHHRHNQHNHNHNHNHDHNHHQPQPLLPMAPPKLPNINIFINKNEIKKLLGIDARINYVTEGNINTYPFGFTIPMGYNQSDIIFTWQNLGQTNVNYSISLVIGNIQAVDPPLINITRSGLIPRHEQVFKITLPCSGKVTDEVDVQVLINILGAVPIGRPQQQLGADLAPPTTLDGDAPDAQQSAPELDLQSAIANSRQQGDASRAPAGSNSSANYVTSEQSAAAAAMQTQADEPQPQQASQMRLVSHTLAIKRKKICTMHPVPMQPAKVRPANQPANKWQSQQQQQQLQQPPPPPQVSEQSQQPQQPQQPQPMTPPAAETNGEAPAHQPNLGPVGAEPHQQHSGGSNQQPALALAGLSAPLRGQGGAAGATDQPASRAPAGPRRPTQAPPAAYPNWPSRLAPGATVSSAPPTQPAGAAPPIAPDNPLNELLIRQQQQQQASQGQAATASKSASSASNPLLFTLMLMSIVVSVALVALLLLSSGGGGAAAGPSGKLRHHPLDKLNALTSCLLRRGQGGCISGRPSSAHLRAHQAHRQSISKSAPIKPSGALINAASRLPISQQQQQQQQQRHQKSFSGLSASSILSTTTTLANKSAYCGFPNANGKWQMASDTMHHHLATSGYSNNCATTNGYYSTLGANNPISSQQQQQHYQPHPPTADLLGTGYLIGQQQTSNNSSATNTTPQSNGSSSSSNNNNNNNNNNSNNYNYPIYHIAADNNSQTTRLFWQQGNGSTPDGFKQLTAGSFLPLAPNGGGGAGSGADSSGPASVYQTIY